MLRKAIGISCLVLLLSIQTLVGQDKPNAVGLNSIKDATQRAAQLLIDGKVLECVELVEKSTSELHKLANLAPRNEMEEIEKLHAELTKTHQLLAIQGAELSDLPSWESMLKERKSKNINKPDGKMPETAPEPTKIPGPNGKETVSFARDVAPILIANCNGCHYNATRVGGGLQFNMFTQIVKGGDSGPIVLPGKPDESLVIRKLKGMEGARMPMGRAPLPDSQIQLVETWIKEGATFDGQNKDAKLDQVAGQAFASKATHNELMTKRVELSREKWKMAFPKGEPDEAIDENFHVIGNIGEQSTKNLLAQANAVSSQIRKLIKLPGKDPLIKGGVTIYALKQRYDYSEFGKMIESRTLPPEWSSHWRKEVLDTYVAMVVDKSESKINQTSLMQQMTSLWVGSREGVPRWFAEGAGRQALALSVGANDLRVQPWLKRIPTSMDQMKSLKALSDGTMNDEALATIGFGVIRTMYDSKMKPQYELILRSLASGMNFDQATTKAIGSMDLFLQKLLGKAK